jgi:uncharacterized membrane protein YbhN (UPF0104 family)
MSRRALSVLLTAGLLVLLGYLARGHLFELRRLVDVPISSSLAILVLFLVSRGVGAEIVRVGLARLGHVIGRPECFMLSILTSYTNLFVPRSGLAPPALYLRRRHDVAYVSYLSLAVATMLIATTAVGVLGLGLHVALSLGEGRPPRPDVVLVFGFVSIGAAFGLLAPVRFFRLFPARVREFLARAHAAWIRLAGDGATLRRIVGLQLLAIVLRSIRLQVAFGAAGVEISFMSALFVSLCADLGSLVSLTPAAVGFREGAMVFGASLIGLSTVPAVLAAIIDRVVCTAGLLVIGQLVVWKGLRGIASDARPTDAS